MTDTVRSELISGIIKAGLEIGTPIADIERNLTICLKLYDNHNQTTQTVTVEQYLSYLQSCYDKEPSYALEETIHKAKDYLNLHRSTLFGQ